MKKGKTMMLKDLEAEVNRLHLVVSIEEQRKNPLVKQYVRKIRSLIARLQELIHCDSMRGQGCPLAEAGRPSPLCGGKSDGRI